MRRAGIYTDGRGLHGADARTVLAAELLEQRRRRLCMRAPRSHARAAHDDPVTRRKVIGCVAAGREDDGGTFVPRNGAGLGGGEGSVEGGFGGIDALDLIDVGGVKGSGEYAEG